MSFAADRRREKLALAIFTRSDKWPKVRKEFLKTHGQCEVCGTKKKLNVHHVLPFQWYPELELDTDNFITLCEGGGQHHLLFGHLTSWVSYNERVREDAATWAEKIKERPKWKR